jgi:hypothetical protein
VIFDKNTGGFLVAGGRIQFHHDNMKEFELKYPREQHFVSTTGLVHSSNPCAGEYATPLPWVVLDALWDYSQLLEKRGRQIGWCEKCCVAEKPKKLEAVA